MKININKKQVYLTDILIDYKTNDIYTFVGYDYLNIRTQPGYKPRTEILTHWLTDKQKEFVVNSELTLLNIAPKKFFFRR